MLGGGLFCGLVCIDIFLGFFGCWLVVCWLWFFLVGLRLVDIGGFEMARLWLIVHD